MNKNTASWKTLLSWGFFDFANTGFYVVIITLVFPVYFNNVLAEGNTAVWGRTISISMLITAVIGPFLGSIADATNRKKLFLGIFTGACVLATTGMFFTVEGMLGLAIVLLIIANVGFEGGTVFYDAFLPEIADRSDFNRVSAMGWAIGYAGSFLTLVAVLFMIGDEPTGLQTRSTFLFAAAFFAVFSIPMFLNVKERRKTDGAPVDGSLIAGYRRLRQTLTHLRSYRDIVRFLTAFFIYNDSILTVIMFAAIFASDVLGLTQTESVIFFMIVQGTALAGSLIFGKVADRFGPRNTIHSTLAIWIVVVVLAYFVQDAAGYFVVGGIAGLALGSSQSTSRSMMALLTPDNKKTEFFGFYDGFFGKASAVLGPWIFGEIANSVGHRAGMLMLGGMFILGMILLTRVPDARAETYVPPSNVT